MQKLSVSTIITPIDNTYTCNSEDTLQAVLANIRNGTDALLAFNDKKEFEGIVSIYHTLYKNNIVPTTKVKNAAFHPIKVHTNTSLFDVAAYMVNEQVHMLPFFSGDTVTGVILAQHILKLVHENTNIFEAISENIAYLKPITVSADSTLQDVYPLLRESAAPGVVVTDEKGKAIDFIHRNELIYTFITPTDKQRFGKNGFRPTDWSFDQEKAKRLDDNIQQYMRGYTIYSDNNDSHEKTISKLLRSQSEVVVNVDKDKVPIKILTVHNILSSFATLKPANGINIIVKKPSNNVSDTEFRHTYNSILTFSEKIHKRLPLEKILVRTEESKYQNRRTAMFDSTIILVPSGEGQYVAQAKSASYEQSLTIAMKQIEKQQRRDHTNENSYTAEQSLDNQSA